MALNRPRPLQIFDPVLTGLARSYRSHGFIARTLLPDIPVSKLSGQYPVFDKAPWFQNDVDNLVVDRAPAKEVDWTWSTENYSAKEYALKTSWTELEIDQADGVLRLEQNKTEFLTQRMELAHEVRVANLLLPPSLGGLLSSTLTHTPSTAWDSTGTPEADIKQGAIAVYRKTGYRPTHMIFDYEVAYALALNASFRTQIRYDTTGKPRDFVEVGDQVLPAVIHGMKVVIADGAQVDTTREGASSETIVSAWGKHVRLLFNPPGTTWGQPATCYLMRHTPKRVTRWQNTDPDVTYIREMERYDIRVTAIDTAYVIKDVIS